MERGSGESRCKGQLLLLSQEEGTMEDGGGRGPTSPPRPRREEVAAEHL